MKQRILLMVILLILLTSCQLEASVPAPTAPPTSEETQEPTPLPTRAPTPEPTPEPTPTPDLPEKALEQALKALKINDEAQANIYLDYGQLTGIDTAEQEANDKELTDVLFSRLSWEITPTTSESQETAIVKAKITTVDMDMVLAQFAVDDIRQRSENDAMSEELRYSEEEMEQRSIQLLLQIIAKTPEKTSSDLEVTLKNVDGSWIIQLDKTLINALTGNLSQAGGWQLH